MLTPDLIIIEITDILLNHTGLRRDQVLGQQLLHLFPNMPDSPNEDSSQLVLKSLQHVLDHKEPSKIEVLRYDLPLPTEQGARYEERYWSTSTVPVMHAQGHVQYLVHEVRDITDKILSDQKRQHSQEHLNLLTSATKAVSWGYDIVNNRMTWGEGLQEVFGYKPEDMGPGGESWDSRVHPDDFAAVQQSIQEALSKKQPSWTGEYRFQKADGTYVYILDQSLTTYDDQDQAIRTIGSIIDITQSKEFENALKESDARFWHLLESLPHMAWTATARGKVLYFNENWYSYTGMKRGQTDGWINFVHPDDSAIAITSWHQAVANGVNFELEYRLRSHFDGTYRWFLERGIPMYDAQGNLSLWMGTFTDIDDQKQSLDITSRDDNTMENLLRLSPVHLCVLQGPEHVCRYITPGVYKIYGNRQYIGRTARQIWPELEPYGFFDVLEEVYRNGKTVCKNEIKTQIDHLLNGEPQDAYFNFKYQPLVDNTNQVEGIMISAIEVTSLVKARQRAEALAKNGS